MRKSELMMIIALRPIFLRSSCSGSAAHERKVTTSFAICEVVAGVPVRIRIRTVIGTTVRAPNASKLKVHTIRIFNDAIEQNSCHCDGTTREVWVVVQAFADFNTSRWVDVTGEQGEDIILTRITVSKIHLPNSHKCVEFCALKSNKSREKG